MQRKDFRAYFTADRADGFVMFDPAGFAEVGCACPTTNEAGEPTAFVT